MSSQLHDRKQLIDQLLRMLNTISQYSGYQHYFESDDALIDHKVYFDICQIIFSQLSIKLIKLQQREDLDDGDKLNFLIKLITDQLGIQMTGLSGKQIVKFNIQHVYEFLNLLLQYSKLYYERGFMFNQPSIKTQPNQFSGQYEDRQQSRFSARAANHGQYSPKSNSQEVPQYENAKRLKENKNQNRNNNKKEGQKNTKGFSKTKNEKTRSKRGYENVRPSSAQTMKKKKSQLLYDELVKVVIEQKNRANKSSIRDKRKNKNEDLQGARKKYQQYLRQYSRQKRAQTQRKQVIRRRVQSIQQKSNHRELPLKDFSQVDNFFRSFNLKLRDMKDVYMRRMKREIRTREQQRMVQMNRGQRENKGRVQKMVERQMECLNNEHRVRRQEMREVSQQLSQEIKMVKREMRRRGEMRRREMVEMRRREMGRLQEVIRQENERVLMELEDGGRLERAILGVYGRF